MFKVMYRLHHQVEWRLFALYNTLESAKVGAGIAHEAYGEVYAFKIVDD